MNTIINFIPDSIKYKINKTCVKEEFINWYNGLSFYKKYWFNLTSQDVITSILIKSIVKKEYSFTKWIINNLSIDYLKKNKSIDNYIFYFICVNGDFTIIKLVMNYVELEKITNLDKILVEIIKNNENEKIQWLISNNKINKNIIELIFIKSVEYYNFELIKFLDDKIQTKIIYETIIKNINNYLIFEYMIENYTKQLKTKWLHNFVIICCEFGLYKQLVLLNKMGVCFNSLYYDEDRYPMKILYEKWNKYKTENYIQIVKWMISLGITPVCGEFFDLYINHVTVKS